MEPKLLIKRQSEDLAEFIGIMLGDGNFEIKPNKEYRIRICGHKENDKDYLLNYVRPLIYKLFKIESGIYYPSSTKSLYLTKSSKDLCATLLYFGLKPGNKKINNIKIPDWIFSNNKYIKACIRGLIDTDGSISTFKNRNYSIIWFKSAIPNLRKDFSHAMNILGYKIAKWSGSLDTLQTYVGSKKFIKKYYEEIGFSNTKHLKRFKIPLKFYNKSL